MPRQAPKQNVPARVDERDMALLIRCAELFDNRDTYTKGTISDVIRKWCELFRVLTADGTVIWELPWLQARIRGERIHGVNAVNGVNEFPRLSVAGGREASSTGRSTSSAGRGPLRYSATHPDSVGVVQGPVVCEAKFLSSCAYSSFLLVNKQVGPDRRIAV